MSYCHCPNFISRGPCERCPTENKIHELDRHKPASLVFVAAGARRAYREEKDSNNKEGTQKENNEEEKSFCSVYLAPSSVPGGRMGFYTAQAFESDEIPLSL